jgi:hypothetical protein
MADFTVDLDEVQPEHHDTATRSSTQLQHSGGLRWADASTSVAISYQKGTMRYDACSAPNLSE